MNYTAMKRFFLKLFLGFLGITAAVAIISVLGGEFGKLQEKILVTCFAVSASSICSMACAAFIERKRQVGLGLAGICLSIVSAIIVIVGVWAEIASDEYWKTLITFTVAAISFAYIFLLMLPSLEEKYKWIQWAFCVSVAVLAMQIIIAVWGEIQADSYYRALAVVAILVGLQTLAIPILSRLHNRSEIQPEKIILERLSDDIYRDAKGKKYRLQEVDRWHEQTAPNY